jgi:hypothetical protein
LGMSHYLMMRRQISLDVPLLDDEEDNYGEETN